MQELYTVERIVQFAAISLFVGLLVIPTSALAATSPYAPNVIARVSTSVTLIGGEALVDNTATTGISVLVADLTGISNANITTESLSAPSSGVTAFSTSGRAMYFYASITLPAGVTMPPLPVATVCFTNPSVASGDTLKYWNHSTWATAKGVGIVGTEICGSVLVSALTGTNLVAAPVTPLISLSSGGYLRILLIVIFIFGAGWVIVGYLILLRKKRFLEVHLRAIVVLTALGSLIWSAAAVYSTAELWSSTPRIGLILVEVSVALVSATYLVYYALAGRRQGITEKRELQIETAFLACVPRRSRAGQW